MVLFVELAPKEIDGRSRTHEVTCTDVAGFKRYVRGQVTGVKNGNKRPTIAEENARNVRPAWAIVKTNSSQASEANTMFMVGVAYHDGKLLPFEKTFSPQFIEGQERIHAS
jgi:hypothetical protein